MMKINLSLLMALVASLGVCADAQQVKAKMDSVALFKNGLAVVHRTVAISKAGQYLVEDVPTPVHGTYWVESDAKVITRLSKRSVDLELHPSEMSMVERFAGRKVTVFLNGEKGGQVSGVVQVPSAPKDKKEWSRNYQRYGYGNWWSGSNPTLASGSADTVAIRTTNGKLACLGVGQIQYVLADGENTSVKRIKPVMLFDVSDVPQGGSTIVISYLTKGLSWTPSYRINLSSEKRMTLEQKAVIKNELTDLDGTKVSLISGFPNVKFANATSALSLDVTWSSFFQQLNRSGSGYQHPSLGNGVMTQQAISYNTAGNSPMDFSVEAKGEGTDIHYQNVGKLTLKEGETLAMTVDRKLTDYHQIIDWSIPDSIAANGRRMSSTNGAESTAWESICFNNPFAFPMTTAPLMITDKNRFLGQTLSYWTNAGQKTVQRVTKALSVATSHTEQELPGERENVRIDHYNYRRVAIRGTLNLKNHRSSPIKVVVRRTFRGTLKTAEGDPKSVLLTGSASDVNEHNQLTWEMEIKAKQVLSVKYDYSVLVRR